MFMNGVPSASPRRARRHERLHVRPRAGIELPGHRTQLRARRFVGNAWRHSRHGAQRLSEIGLGETAKDGRVERRCHADGVTCGAIAAFVKRVRRVIMRAWSAIVVRAVIAARIHMMMLSAWRPMIVPVVVHHRRTRVRRLRRAKRHDRGRVALERHRKHHEPQQECTEMDHRGNCRGVAWPRPFANARDWPRPRAVTH